MKKIHSVRQHLQTYWFLYCLAALALVFVGELLLGTSGPRENQPVWNNLWVGKSTKELTGELANAVAVEQTEHGTTYQLESDFRALNNEVVVADNQVVFIKELVSPSEDQYLPDYIEQYGQPNLQLYAPFIASSTEAYVFLDAGLVIFAHEKDKAVEQRWLFEPMSEEDFLQQWGQNLPSEPAGPEPISTEQ